MDNKTYTLKFKTANQDVFKAIRMGSKKIETRAATVKYRDIKSGDILIFVCGRRKFERKVKDARIFKTINAMLRVHKVKDIMPSLNSKADLEKAYFSYPKYKEKIKKFGLMAFRIN